MNFSKQLNKTLEQKQMSGYKLAKITGISETRIYAMINGKSNPSLENLLTIADALDISLDDLVGRTRKEKCNE